MEYPIVSFSVNEKDMPIEEAEVLRYLGYSKPNVTEDDKLLVRDVIKEIRPLLNGKACYRRFEIEVNDNKIKMPYGEVESGDLSRNLAGCKEIYIFAATIGVMFDRNLVKEKFKSMAKTSILQAIGATAVEDVVEALVAKLGEDSLKNGEKLRPRYSPGFGDYVLENQRGIFSVLTPEKYTGITLMNTLIMAPEKSVTAVIGIDKLEEK